MRFVSCVVCRLDYSIISTQLNQTQLQALQTIQDQQGKLIALISPVSHLLDALPVRIDGAKHEIMNVLRESNNLSQEFRNEMATFKADIGTMLSVTLATPSCECQQRAAGSPLVASTASWSKLSPRKRRKIDEEVAAPPLSSVCSARANNSSSSLSLASSVPGSVQSLPSPASSHPAFPELPDDKSDAGSGSWSDRSSSLEVVSCPSYATDQASPGISVSAIGGKLCD